MDKLLPRWWQQASGHWSRWNRIQKASVCALTGGAIVAVTLLGTATLAESYDAGGGMVALFGAAIPDEQHLFRVASRLDQEGARYEIRPDNRIFVADQSSARRLRAILIREDLIPPQTDPFALFNVDRFSMTDFERNVNLQRALTRNLEQHIVALDDIVAANVTLVVPERELFTEDQNPTTASIIITPRVGSDILQNRKKVTGIQRLVQFAVAGLSAENIVILDHHGVPLIDSAGFEERDRVALVRRQLDTKFDLEQRYKGEILAALGAIFGADRVQVVRLDIDLDLSVETIETEEHFPITLRADDPLTPNDETVNIPSITVSKEEQRETFRAAGQEGMVAEERSSVTQNEVVNRRNTVSEKSPWTINRITVSVAIDGVWRSIFQTSGQVALNADGSVQRAYTPVSADDLRKARLLVEDAIGWDERRADSVTVEHLQFDRTGQFREQDEVLRREAELLRMLPLVTAGVGLLLVLAVFAGWRTRRRRLRASAHPHPARLSAAARGAGAGARGAERTRAARQNAVELAREHPEDAARALRTWLVED